MASSPRSLEAIIELTFSTAFKTDLPRYCFASPSRSSQASSLPVEAPDGTAHEPCAPLSSKTVASIVGNPLESIICSDLIDLIMFMKI